MALYRGAASYKPLVQSRNNLTLCTNRPVLRYAMVSHARVLITMYGIFFHACSDCRSQERPVVYRNLMCFSAKGLERTR